MTQLNKALIIGFGPSFEDNIKEYKRLGKFPGKILCTDAALARCLEEDIIPDFVVTLEDGDDLDKYFKPDIVKKKGHLTSCLTADRTHQNIIEALKVANMSWTTATSCKDYMNTSNVGLYSWFIAWRLLNCKEIYMIAMDHCYSQDKPPNVDQNSELFKYGFYKFWNAYNDEHLILNPAHQLWKEEFEYHASFYRKSEDIKTINLTGRGALWKRGVFNWLPIKTLKNWP